MNTNKTSRVTALALLALAVVLVAAVPGRAEEPRVYTNADLAALPAPDLPASPAPASHPDVAEPSLAYEAPKLESVAPGREEAIFLAERAVEQARARVDELEGKLLAVENPFLPRPVLSAEEQRLWLHLDNVQRARLVEDQIADATADLVMAETLLQRVGGTPR